MSSLSSYDDEARIELVLILLCTMHNYANITSFRDDNRMHRTYRYVNTGARGSANIYGVVLIVLY